MYRLTVKTHIKLYFNQEHESLEILISMVEAQITFAFILSTDHESLTIPITYKHTF